MLVRSDDCSIQLDKTPYKITTSMDYYLEDLRDYVDDTTFKIMRIVNKSKWKHSKCRKINTNKKWGKR